MWCTSVVLSTLSYNSCLCSILPPDKLHALYSLEDSAIAIHQSYFWSAVNRSELALHVSADVGLPSSAPLEVLDIWPHVILPEGDVDNLSIAVIQSLWRLLSFPTFYARTDDCAGSEDCVDLDTSDSSDIEDDSRIESVAREFLKDCERRPVACGPSHSVTEAARAASQQSRGVVSMVSE
jgi:hypothetical protein